MELGLFERWLEIEKANGKPVSVILEELNKACGTKYRHNWPSVMARRGYSLDRLPTCVRQHMMAAVLPVELAKTAKNPTRAQIEDLIISLT